MNLKGILEGNSVIATVKENAGTDLVLVREQENNIIRYGIKNNGSEAVSLKEVVLYEGPHGFKSDSFQYGEGYQMLSQYDGELKELKSFTKFTDYGHYKMAEKEGYNTVYNMTWIQDGDTFTLVGFSTCHRFVGAFHVNKVNMVITLNLEGMNVEPGQTLQLEDIMLLQGKDVNNLIDLFAEELSKNHPPILRKGDVPTGWCSWYCYGPDINEEIIKANMQNIKENNLDMKYIQIDDGYQPKMGDWLEPNDSFGMDMKELCLYIKDEGFEPAVWVAPFIAEATSKLFTEHPDWFIKDDEGKPLVSNSFTFGGWRCGPWYMLDGTHPEAQNYLTHVFKTMREEWKTHYFKLDANVWGAFPTGHHYDENATCVEAYRRGMEACLKGAGEDSFLLGCNAPMWPSLGTVHGMRVTSDIARTWKLFSQLCKEGMHRNWQHNRLWVNDPDCIVLENIEKKVIDAGGAMTIYSEGLSESEFDYHKAYVVASGGMVLGSDPMMQMSDKSRAELNKIIKYRGEAATFTDQTLTYGMIKKETEELVILFNESEEERSFAMKPEHQGNLVDFWTEEAEVVGESMTLPAHSARVLIKSR